MSGQSMHWMTFYPKTCCQSCDFEWYFDPNGQTSPIHRGHHCRKWFETALSKLLAAHLQRDQQVNLDIYLAGVNASKGILGPREQDDDAFIIKPKTKRPPRRPLQNP